MRTASIRELQHHVAGVMRHVERGEEVTITRRGRVVARLLPANRELASPVTWPDFEARARRAVRAPRGRPLSVSLVDDRDD